MATKEKKHSNMHYGFHGLSDMLEFIEGLNLPMDNISHNWRYGHDYYKKGWDEYVKDVRFGNADDCQMFAGELDALESMMKAERDGMAQDVSGYILDIGAYLDGTPECFRRKTRVETKPVVRIMVDMGMNCGVPGVNIMNRGIGITALVNELQLNGFAVELHVAQKSNFGTSYKGVSTMDTDMEINCNPIDIGELSCICHPCFLRRFILSLIEDAIGADHARRCVYGHPMDASECDYEIVFAASKSWKFDKHAYDTLRSTKDQILKMLADFRETGKAIG